MTAATLAARPATRFAVRPHVLPLGGLLLLRVLMTAILAPRVFGAADTTFFYKLASESAAGRYPLIQYWIEYPPLYPWLTVGLFKLAVMAAPASPRPLFSALLMAQNSLLELATLCLLYCLAVRLYGRVQAIKVGVLYALLVLPLLFALLGMMEALPQALLLGGLLAALARRGAASGVLTGLGVLAKVYPAALLPAALTWLGPGGRLRWLASAAAVVVLGLTPFVLVSPAVVQTSARVMASRPPYETPWVFLEGCCFDGRMPDPAQRDATLPDLPRTAGVVPWPLVTLAAVAALLFVLLRRRAGRRARNRLDHAVHSRAAAGLVAWLQPAIHPVAVPAATPGVPAAWRHPVCARLYRAAVRRVWPAGGRSRSVLAAVPVDRERPDAADAGGSGAGRAPVDHSSCTPQRCAWLAPPRARKHAASGSPCSPSGHTPPRSPCSRWAGRCCVPTGWAPPTCGWMRRTACSSPVCRSRRCSARWRPRTCIRRCSTCWCGCRCCCRGRPSRYAPCPGCAESPASPLPPR